MFDSVSAPPRNSEVIFLIKNIFLKFKYLKNI